MNYPLLLAALLFSTFYACATSEPASTTDEEQRDEPFLAASESGGVSPVNLDRLNDRERLFYQTRSRLTDHYTTYSHDIPEVFLQEVEEVEVDIYAGYRIQLLSTRDMTLADSIHHQFNSWADSTFQGYAPHAYIHFRQPYYRVRVGDFHNHERANEFSRILKSAYPDAWVVHDRINPYRVPADTVDFTARR